MRKRPFRPEDAVRLKKVAEPDLSPDGRRVAFTLSEADDHHDRVASSVWVVDVDGSRAPRRFTEGPADHGAEWSPDGRWLAFISEDPDRPLDAHLRLASAEGGAPSRLAQLPGPVEQLSWGPDSSFLVVACRVGVPDPEKQTAAQRNQPRVVRGLAARLDGRGWREGRLHLFVVHRGDGEVRQLTSGEFDHLDATVSPDGRKVAFASDRSRRRDDHQNSRDIWVISLRGGRPRRLSWGRGDAMAPLWSPDGTRIAFAGRNDDRQDADIHLWVAAVDGSSPPERLAPDTDRGMSIALPGEPASHRWIDDRTLAVLLADSGGVHLHIASIGSRRTRTLVEGTEVTSLSVRPGDATIVYSSAWVDQPHELSAISATGRGAPRPITAFHEKLLAEVELAPVERESIVRPDGTTVEYFLLRPPRRRRRHLPLHLDVHGGPEGWWPTSSAIGLHQALAAAGYLVVLPNPRGSGGYGEAFVHANFGDWGGEDYEDILACCDDVVARGLGDPDRMHVSGYSYGGFMTAWIVGHTDRFRAAASCAPVIDQVSMLLTTDVPEFARYSMGGGPWQDLGAFRSRSPLTYLPQATTPTMVMHWEGDLRCPIGQGEELWTALRLLGRETELVRYPGGSHDVHSPSQDVDWITRIIEWDRAHDAGLASTR